MYILLCGQPPFKGKTHKEIFEKIRVGKFAFSQPEWQKVTREAKSLIKKLLTFEPKDRISAEEALADTWIADFTGMSKKEILSTLQQPIMGSIINNISKINVE